MSHHRLSINEELRNMRSKMQQGSIGINFKKIIRKQQEFISSLQQQILLLKSYISLGAISSPALSSIVSPQVTQQHKIRMEPLSNEDSKQYQSLVQNLANVLEINEAKNIHQEAIITAIKELKDIIKKKSEPIFVQRIKQVKVPFPIEKIIEKPVEKIIEKIVYVEKPTVVFKEKIVEKFIERKQQPSLNVCQSEKTLKIQRSDKDKDLQQSRYSNKNYQNYHNDYHRKPEFGSNLIKKRQNPARYFASKRDSYQRQY